MTDYTELVKVLRYCSTTKGMVYCNVNCKYGWEERSEGCKDILMTDAAAAIEDLQADVQFYKALADEWQSAAENKERLLGLYRAEQAKRFYSATDNNGRVISNPCACMNIPVFSDCSESPNS